MTNHTMTIESTETALPKPNPIEPKAMFIYATPEAGGHYKFHSEPEKVTFHNKSKSTPRALECILVDENGAPSSELYFTGYSYLSSAGMSMFASGLSSNVITIAFNFAGREMSGHLTFFISNGGSAKLQMDPQVGNDPPT